MDRPTVSSQDSGSSSRCWDDPPTARTRHHWARTRGVSERLRTRDATTWIPSKEGKKEKLWRLQTESVLDERKMFSFDGRFGSRTCRRTRVFLMSSLSLRLLERCKVCLFKTPFSLCQKKINAVHTATFLFYFGSFCSFVFLFCIFFFNFTWITNRYSCFISALIIYFDLDVLCKKGPLWKSVETYGHKYPVYYTFFKCVCTCIFVCVWIYV